MICPDRSYSWHELLEMGFSKLDLLGLQYSGLAESYVENGIRYFEGCGIIDWIKPHPRK